MSKREEQESYEVSNKGSRDNSMTFLEDLSLLHQKGDYADMTR